MNDIGINFVKDFQEKKIKELTPRPKKSRAVFFLKIFLIVAIAFFVFFSNIVFSDDSILNGSFGLFPKIGLSKMWLAFRGYVLGQDKILKGESEDRINILLLGMGGKGHQGPYLTDTIILVSIKPSTGKLALVSIPRDLYVPIIGHGWRKINNANAFGEAEQPGSGGLLASQTISNVLNLPINYYLRIDFKGFEKLIDDLGGIKVYVERDFIDYQYPAPNFKYQVVSFKKGWQKMDGDTALKFARSRHGTNGEGSDFARAKRQQKILLAIKNKALALSTLMNPAKINKMIQNLENSIATNLDLEEMIRLAKMAGNIDTKDIISFTLNNNPDNFLVSDTTLDGAFILRPKTGNFNDLAFFVNHIFENAETVSGQTKKRKEENTQPLKKTWLLILNGTTKTGLARTTAAFFKTLGFSVPRVSNAPRQDYEKTVIYKLDDTNPDALSLIKEKLNANVSKDLPAFLKNSILEGEKFDFLIVLGLNNVEK